MATEEEVKGRPGGGSKKQVNTFLFTVGARILSDVHVKYTQHGVADAVFVV